MNKKTRTMTLSALFTALTVVFLYIANLVPVSRLGLIAAASLFIIAAVIENGLIAAVFVFAGSSVLGALLLPDKTAILLFILFFGYYPIVKSLAERSRSVIIKWAVKVVVFEAAFSVIWFLFNSLIFDGKYLDTSILLIYPAATLVFIVFDLGLSRLIGLYIHRITKTVKKNI